MTRRIRWLLLALVLLVVAVTVVALLVVEPGLSDAEDSVDISWGPLRAPLQARYAALGTVGTVLEKDAADRPVTKDLTATLERWRGLAARGDQHTDPRAEAATANLLEALARRARANYSGSDRLKADPAFTAAFAAFDQRVVPPPLVGVYDAAVRAYERERSGTFHRLVAGALGYESRAQLELGS